MIRYALSRRWVTWHLLWVVLVAVCLRLAVWQWTVASAPHVPGAPVQVWRNYAYAVNWLIFAVVGVWFWWRFMRDQRASEMAATQDATAPSAASDWKATAEGSLVADPTPSTTPAVGQQPPAVESVRDPVTGGRRRFDPFADSAEPTEGAREDPTVDR